MDVHFQGTAGLQVRLVIGRKRSTRDGPWRGTKVKEMRGSRGDGRVMDAVTAATHVFCYDREYERTLKI